MIQHFQLCIEIAIRVLLRGKAHCEWKMMIQNEKRTVKDEEIFIDDRALIYGTGKCIRINSLDFFFDTKFKLFKCLFRRFISFKIHLNHNVII